MKVTSLSRFATASLISIMLWSSPVQSQGFFDFLTKPTANPVTKSAVLQTIEAVPMPALETFPERVEIGLDPKGWTREFITRTLDLAFSKKDGTVSGSIAPGMLLTIASYYALVGDTDKTKAVLAYRPPFSDDPVSTQKIAEECAKPRSEKDYKSDDCAGEVAKEIWHAALLLVLGNAEASNSAFAHADSYTNAMMARLFYGNIMDVNQSSWLAARFRYLFLAGRMPEALAALKDFRTYESKQQIVTRTATNLPVEHAMAILMHSGRTRDQMMLALTATKDRGFDDLGITRMLFLGFDNGVLRRESPKLLEARLRVISEIVPRYANAGAGFVKAVGLNLECRAALVEMEKGRRESAGVLFKSVSGIYLNEEEDLGQELGLCLYRLVPSFGPEGMRGELLKKMTVSREQSKQRIENHFAGIIKGIRSSGYTNIAANSENTQLVLKQISLLMNPQPRAPVYLEPKAFDQVFDQVLEITKDPQIAGVRDYILMRLIDMSLERLEYVGED